MGEIFNGLMAIFLVSRLIRLILWIFKKWNGGAIHLIVCDLLAGVVGGIVGGFGFANGGPYAWNVFIEYLALSIPLVIFDLVRLWIKKRPQPAN